MNFESEAYPQIVVLLLAPLGLALAVVKPRWLFYGIFACHVIADYLSYSFTRLQITGPYFNLFDLLIVLGLLVVALDYKRSQGLRLPLLWYLLTACLCISFLATYMALDLNYEVLRFGRMAFAVPLFWLVGKAGIVDRDDAKVVLWTVALGCILQSIRHCWYVALPTYESGPSDVARTLRYLNAGLVVVPVCFLFFPFDRRLWKFVFYFGAGIAFVSLVLTQTRSMWIPQAVVLAVGCWYLPYRRVMRTALPLVCVAVAGGVLYRLCSPHAVNVFELFFYGRSTDFSSGNGREEDIVVEWNAWLDSNLVFGCGLGYMFRPEYRGVAVAWGHNGYLAYLSNLGVVGFVIYALALPYHAFQCAARLLRGSDMVLRSYGALLVALTIYMVVASALSVGLLMGSAFPMFLLLLGGVHGLAENSIASDIVDGRTIRHSPVREESLDSQEPELA